MTWLDRLLAMEADGFGFCLGSGGSLRVGPSERLTDEHRSFIRSDKAKIIELLEWRLWDEHMDRRVVELSETGALDLKPWAAAGGVPASGWSR